MLKKSPLHGYGIFATRDYEPGDEVGRSRYFLVPSKVARQCGQLWDYVWSDSSLGLKNPGYVLVLLGDGMVYNHSDDPNVRIEIVDDQVYRVRCLRDIKRGEEILVCYSENYWATRPKLVKE